MKNRLFIKTQILFPKYIIPVISMIIMLLAGCVENSALSDVEIEDPSVIKPIVEINKSLSANSVMFTTTAWLYDKNGNSIELKSGKVIMNDIPMNVKYTGNDVPYYQLDYSALPFKINTTYSLDVTLSDGESYSASVTTREKDIKSFIVPAEHNKNNDLVLSWGESVSNEKLVLKMSLLGKTDTTVFVDDKEISITDTKAGSFTVPKSYFDKPGYYHADLTLTSLKTGAMSKSFMNGSKITSTISISRSLSLK